MLNLLIARHGNTFDQGDEILRVGKQTNLPLSLSGQAQAKALGGFLRENYSHIDQVLVSNLIRTQETAQISLGQMGLEKELYIDSLLDEIDYGPDEGKPEADVVARLGEDALAQWEEKAIAPNGWKVDPDEIIQGWKNLASKIIKKYKNKKEATVLVVTSNGIARFSPYIAGDFDSFSKTHSMKMKTGAVSCFQYVDSAWQLKYWNQR